MAARADASWLLTKIFVVLIIGILVKKPLFTNSEVSTNLTRVDAAISFVLIAGDNETCPGPQADGNVGRLTDFTFRKGVKLFHQNCRGLTNCLPNLTALFSERKTQFHLSQRHIVHESDSLFCILGFQFVEKRQKTGQGGGGGVAIYVSENINWKRREDLECEFLENIWIEICPEKAKHYLICCMYRPPDNSLHLHKKWKEYFQYTLETVNDLSLEVIIMGDLNVNYKNKNDHSEFKELMAVQEFNQLVTAATRTIRETSTLIDLIYTNNHSLIRSTKVIPLSIGDHDCVACVRRHTGQKLPPKVITCRNYTNYNHDDFLKELNKQNWKHLYTLTDVISAWSYFKNILLTVIDKHAPLIQKRVKAGKCPWLGKSGNNGTCTSAAENLTKAGSFCSYFSTCANKLKSVALPMKEFMWGKRSEVNESTNSVFAFTYVSNVFVESQLKKLHRKKATGYDQIPSGLLKDGATALSSPLSFIINLSLKTATMPTEWKLAKVIPLHKGGKMDKMSHYRPISILPVISKMMERAVYVQLVNYLEENEILTPNQYGYRKKRSTELATLYLTEEIRKEMDKGNLTGALYVDLSKACDTLSHSILLSKLRSYGVKGLSLNWFAEFLFNRAQICKVNGPWSKPNPLVLVVLNFADDAVLYIGRKTSQQLEIAFNAELKNVNRYFIENELVLNLKAGKTESMICGTRKNLNKNGSTLEINGKLINATTEYRYLGTVLDQTLSMNHYFISLYMKMSAKLRLLLSLKSNLTNNAITKIYVGMLLPTLLYCCTTNLNLTNGQQNKLQSLNRRIAKVTEKRQVPIMNEIKKHAVMLVRKCLDKAVCSKFEDFFEIRLHSRNTRNNNYLLTIPRVRLEVNRTGFKFMGSKIYNDLPIEIRKLDTLPSFVRNTKSYFDLS
ncbi:uncharacterized protein LOC130630163 [Hydractinia symbiolongicarpus]|uniref:uncharacterized protein LOC130630163 n=1 Tax=Hydractinia symbiolongicarpus TaxID=13093 RepID=UPI00254A9969|nr:uncharacterized protein LOC130630163 [Hydractinia symbiolongicarpus]